ncbi:hypothetical protein QTP86_003733 [Hemibagrus guttatus]|nr:hypothetical protein QTP86_003733 [Hemibagrus guttatus]
MPEPPQRPPFDVEEQRLYSELLPGDRAPYPISKGAPCHPTEEAHFGRLYPGSYPFGHDPELMAIEKPISPKAVKGFDVPQLTKNYYSVVVQDILEHEREFVKELQTVLTCYLRPLQSSDKVSSAESSSLCGNLEEILTFQQGLCTALEECSKMPEGQQRLGGCYMNMMCQIRMLYLSYCSSHPSAVAVLTDHRFDSKIYYHS